MQSRRFSLLGLGLVGVIGCSSNDVAVDPTTETRDEAIINGHECASGEANTAVAILIDAEMSVFGMTLPIKSVLCTGTLIAPDVVLAAAHCFDEYALTQGYGTLNRAAWGISFESDLVALVEAQQGTPVAFPADTIMASSVVKHPDFDLKAMSSSGGLQALKDVGLMFLSKSVTGVAPEIVVTKDEAAQLSVGSAVEIAGWGQQKPTSGPYDKPPAGSVGKKVCATAKINELGPDEMQIGSDSASSRKCHGDSGGPSYLTVQTSSVRKARVVGITSHAYDATDCAKGGVDTRVDAVFDWVDATMKSGCTSGKRAWCDVAGVIPPEFYDNWDGGTAGAGGSGGSPDAGVDVGTLEGGAGMAGADAGQGGSGGAVPEGGAGEAGAAGSVQFDGGAGSGGAAGAALQDASEADSGLGLGDASAGAAGAGGTAPKPSNSADESGCSCSSVGQGSAPFGALAALAWLGLVLFRRPRVRVREA